MNTIFVLMLITSTGITEAPNGFSSLYECQRVSDKIKIESYCVEKNPVNIKSEMAVFMSVFKEMKREMDK